MSTTDRKPINTIQQGSFRFADGLFARDLESTYYYTDEYFRRSAEILDPHLRTMSCVFCMSCFPSTEAREYERVYRNAEKLLGDIGFSDLKVNADYEKEPSADTLGALVAHKIIIDGEDEVSVVAVGLRGANYGNEWAMNLIMGAEGPAEGFQTGMFRVKDFLDGYLEQMQDRLARKVKFWITGFSRVAATANLLGAWIDRHAEEYHTSSRSIYVYTFETPLVAPGEDCRPYPSIHNTINPHDLVSFLAPARWGFRRYGADDTCFPKIGSAAFLEEIDQVRARVRRINPEIDYDPRSFRPVYLRGLRMMRGAGSKENPRDRSGGKVLRVAELDEFLGRFMDFMSGNIAHPEDGADPMPDDLRKRFCTSYQKGFSELATAYLGPTEEIRSHMRTAIVELVKKDITPARKLWILCHLWHSTERSFHRIEQYLAGVMRNRVMAAPASEVGTDELREFFCAVEKVIYYFIKCASIDLRRHHFSYLPSLFLNLGQVRGSHMPEVIFAWLQVMDPYYVSS